MAASEDLAHPTDSTASGPTPSQPPPWSSVRVFLPPNTAGPSRLPPPQDDEPKPTPAEIKQAFASHINQRHGPDAPLMTQAMREREDARLGVRKKEYTECRIRVRFSDRTMLEGTLPAVAGVPALYQFVRAHLDAAHPAASTPFVLYQTPPKRDFPESTKDPKLRGKTLKELGMAPQAALNIHWENPEMNANTYPAPLGNDTMQKAEPLPSPPVFDGSTTGNVQPGATGSSKDTGSNSSGDAKKTIPKWLKGLQKK